MSDAGAKAVLRHYLDGARDALLWKLDGLSEYDVRRPLTPTGTNLLGLVKHVAGVEGAYFGEVFGRPFPEAMPWMELSAAPNSDMWATADESTADIVELYGRVRAHADATIEALDLDATGRVGWWGPGGEEVTLQQILVHVVAENHRHAGHADIVRELVDGATGVRPGGGNLPDEDQSWWVAYHDRLDDVARGFRPDH
ncbi:DinB family protein [Paractinoplanes durhamensis]|uniref:DinB family protein n=1 Tax=Paractinoplanes durhamensis TaxID=113563 RepID=UPI001941E8C3|nr:DinB family protein [Actinoplanes durhamensis]